MNQVKMEVYDAFASLAAAKEQVGIAQIGLQMGTKELELARERYTVIMAASHFELTNRLSAGWPAPPAASRRWMSPHDSRALLLRPPLHRCVLLRPHPVKRRS